MRARILARKSNPGNRGGLHYSQFRRYLATRASQIQLLAFRPRRENRRPLSPIREVGLGIFDPARCRRNPDFWGGFPPKPRSVLRNRQGIPRLSGVSSRAHEAGMRELWRAAGFGSEETLQQ